MGKEIKEISRQRASWAYSKVMEFKGEFEKYRSYVKKMPMLIKNNGLASALAFAQSKKGEWGSIYNQLEEWAKERGMVKSSLMEEVLEMTTPEYIRLTEELMALLSWMRRFADAREG